MRYEHTPRPEVEHHFHIRDLIEAQEKRVDDRNYHRDKEKLAQERNDLIKDAKPKDVREFWCDMCKEEFVAESFKEVETDWSCPTQYVAFYRSKCFKGHWCMRLITDRHKDPYFFRSRRIRMEQGKHAVDVTQPYETNYELLYGRKNK